jgi:hypothetical protein
MLSYPHITEHLLRIGENNKHFWKISVGGILSMTCFFRECHIATEESVLGFPDLLMHTKKLQKGLVAQAHSCPLSELR